MQKLTDLWNGTYAKRVLIIILVTILILLLFPIVYNIILSFEHKHAFLREGTFAGLSNYEAAFKSQAFWNSFLNGALYSFASVALQLVVGIFCAEYINNRTRGGNLLQGLIIMPYLMPTVIVIILWKWLLNSTYGIVPYLLSANPAVSWFNGTRVMLVLIFVSTWQFFPFVTIFVLARLRSIPLQLYRSAIADGASASQVFFRITLPAIKNVLLTLVFIRFIWMFTKFDIVWLLAGSGSSLPYVENLPVQAYRQTFKYFQAGMGATVSTIMLVIVAAGSIFYFKNLSKE